MASSKNTLKLTVTEWSSSVPDRTVERFLNRPPFEPGAEKAAREILEDIRKRGDRAVAEYAEKFDGARLTPARFRVGQEAIDAAEAQVDAAFRKAAREADRRIARFARAGLRRDWRVATPRGGKLGERFTPLDRVGAYIPGGEAPLVSTALMTITLARVAGVPEIVACSPAGPDGEIDPYTLYAMKLAGATEIYRIGGIQAVGAMAYGTRTIRPVRKIVGPGGPYVTAAKRQVYGIVDLDLVAGPSEIAILADSSASPVHVAADLLAQAEHGTGSEKALLVTSSKVLARRTLVEIERQLPSLSRASAIRDVLRRGTLIALVKNLNEGMTLCNRFAPEHFELLVKNPTRWVPRVTAAGAIFVGPWTPEVAGDFAAGPSHVLPTGGAAHMFSGLTVDDFQKRTSVLQLTRADLQEVLPVIQGFARVETLDGHGRSAEVRFTS